VMLTLWDLIKQVVSPPERPRVKVAPGRKKVRKGRPQATSPRRRPSAAAKKPRRSMEERYEQITREYLEKHGVKVRKWRKAMSGIATEVKFKDGRIARYIESPRPRGPMSMAVFLHEIGHHAIGFNTYRPRCLEEYHAWRFAIEHMESLGLNITENVQRRMHNSLRYAVNKARRRGIKEIPAELLPYERPWTGTQRTAQGAQRTPGPRPR
jgi:hypothetical protein